MSVEETDILVQLAVESSGRLMLSDMTRRNRAVALRMAVNTNFVRIVGDAACLTQRGHDALKKITAKSIR